MKTESVAKPSKLGTFLLYFTPAMLIFIAWPNTFTFLLVCFAGWMGLRESKPLRATIQPLLPVHVTSEELAHQLAAMRTAHDVLDTLPVFDPDETQLEKAWAERDIEHLDSILKGGDSLTRTSWHKGIGLFNAAIASVEKARKKLVYLLDRSERLLATFQIDYERIEATASKSLEGSSPVLERKEFITERLNYAQGIGSTAGKMVSGNVPWQVALPVVIGVVAWNFINRSRALRQLKELEGKLAINSEMAKKDFQQFRTLLRLRLIPQMDGLIRLTNSLEISISEAEAIPTSARAFEQSKEKAFLLASALVEGKRFLAMSAGD